MEKTTLEQLNLLDNFLFGTMLGYEEVDGDPEDYPRELVQLLAYMKNSIPENACNPDLMQIHSCVDKVKKDPKVREVFMTLEQYVEMEKDEVRMEERKRAEAAEKRADEANDRANKAERQLVASIRRLMNAPNSSVDDAMDILGIEADMRGYYKAMLYETEM